MEIICPLIVVAVALIIKNLPCSRGWKIGLAVILIPVAAIASVCLMMNM